MSTKLAARMWIVVLLTLIFFAIGFIACAPEKSIHWIGRGGIVAFGVFAVPAFYLTVRTMLGIPSGVALMLALGIPVAIAWVWILRWLQ